VKLVLSVGAVLLVALLIWLGLEWTGRSPPPVPPPPALERAPRAGARELPPEPSPAPAAPTAPAAGLESSRSPVADLESRSSDPVVVERQRLLRLRMNDRWQAAEARLGHPIPIELRAKVVARFERVAESAAVAVRERDARRMKPEAALERLSQLRKEYRHELMSELGLSESQLDELASLPR
jgi:hypothetical protein